MKFYPRFIRLNKPAPPSGFPSSLMSNFHMGAFTNYVYKRRGVGGQKHRLFVNFYTIENVNGGGQKKPNLVNVVCERPLMNWEIR